MFSHTLACAGRRLHRRPMSGIQRGSAAALSPEPPGGNRHPRYASTDTSSTVSAGSSGPVMGTGTKLKTMDQCPESRLLNNLYWLFIKGYFNKTQKMQIEMSKIYGPIWISRMGPLDVVNVARADLIEQVVRQEGRLPIRTDMPHWRRYRENRNHAQGPLSEMGIKWQRIRSILNPRMLKPKHVSSYSNIINEVVTDFIQRVDQLRGRDQGGVLVHDVTGELYKFAFEGICSVLFETRMGCMEEEVPEQTQKFIESVGEMFRLSQIVIIFPSSVWPRLPFWKQFEATWDFLFEVAEELVLKKVEQIQEKVKADQELEGAYLTHLLFSDKMTITEILGSMTELLLAGVDTTSNTLSWTLYHLARQPEIQEQLYQEVMEICPGDQAVTSDHVAQMSYLKAVIRETLRMYPVVPGNARVNVNDEVVVGDYIFPKDTLFHMCHYATSYDEDVFPDPLRFQPDRWLRKNKNQQHPFGSIPFGFGVRACLGRRVAELEMYLALSRVMKTYEVRPDPAGTTVPAITRTLLCPAKPISLQFLDRRREERPRARGAAAAGGGGGALA